MGEAKVNVGLNTEQLRFYVVRPTLEAIDLWSLAAENLLIGTALQESRCHYLKQLGKGPALGIYQFEPATYHDLYANFLAYQPKLRDVINSLAIAPRSEIDLIGNLRYATGIARAHYRRSKYPLPDANDALSLARMWKQVYNTPLGAGSVEEALPHFERAVQEGAA